MGKQGRTFSGQDACLDLHAVVKAGIVAELEQGVNRAGFGVWAAVDQPGDAGIDDSASAHWAGLERDD